MIMKPYTLNLIISGDFSLNTIYTSSQMYSYFLAKHFCNLKHITVKKILTSQLTDIPTAQFSLIHALLSELSIDYHKISVATSIKTASFLEIAISQIDLNFTYVKKDNSILINAPIEKSLYTNVAKENKSILLDHAWRAHFKGNPNIDSEFDWTFKILNVLEKLKDKYKIYKLFRSDEQLEWYEKYPWITIIKQSNFNDYLSNIKNKEIFISTHCGSYNSTVVDMLAFGSKVIIPQVYYTPLKVIVPFIPQYNIDLFQLPIVESIEQLIDEIKKPIDQNNWNKKINYCTDMIDAVNIIDNEFQKYL